MRKNFIYVLFLAAIFVVICPSCIKAEDFNVSRTVYITTKTYAYEKPDTNSSIVCDAYGYTKLEAKKYNDKWYVVSQSGEDVYVNAKYVSEIDPCFLGRSLKKSESYSFLYNDNVSDEKFKFIEDTFKFVPQKLIDNFEMLGWKVYVTDRNISTMFLDGSSPALGTCLYDRKEIWLSNRVKTNDVIVHEFAHYADTSKMIASYTDEFQNIYQSEVNTFAEYHKTSKKNYNTPYEYFAESYAECILNPVTFSEKCPMTFAYLNNYCNNL